MDGVRPGQRVNSSGAMDRFQLLKVEHRAEGRRLGPNRKRSESDRFSFADESNGTVCGPKINANCIHQISSAPDFGLGCRRCLEVNGSKNCPHRKPSWSHIRNWRLIRRKHLSARSVAKATHKNFAGGDSTGRNDSRRNQLQAPAGLSARLNRESVLKEWWPETGLNRRRRPFQGRALPLSYLASVQTTRCNYVRGIRRCRKKVGWSTNSALQQPCQYINSVADRQTRQIAPF
jgi:hypothetical protein